MKKRLLKFSIFVIIALALFTAVDFVLAQDIGINYANNLGLQDTGGTDIKTLIINIIRYVLTFLGIIAVVMIMYGGFIWMTSNGQPDRIQKAKKTLIAAAIGLIIVISAFAIVTFIANITGDILEGSCTVGDPPKTCGCQDMGVKTCQADGTWGDCSADCNYAGGEKCCAWGCDTSCLVPPEFRVDSTVPVDGEGNAIRNIKVIFNFNRTVDEAGFTDDKFLVEDIDSGLPIVGGRVVDGRRIIFTPEAGCGVNDCGATNCFASGQKVRVTAENGAGGILSVGAIELICPFTGCIIEFTVGDIIDCEDPEVSLDFNQICAINNNELYAIASDDSGLSVLEFFADDSSVLDISNPILFGGDLSVSTRPDNPVWWDASGIEVSTPVTIRVDAHDIDNHFGNDSETFKLRPAHCCNGVLDIDEGEEGVDCGGSCAGCEGAACGISLFESCGVADTTNCDDSLCASGLCACTSFGADTECSNAGYSGGIMDCCICQDAPIIDYISPMGGFCSSSTDIYCGDNDAVCDDIIAGDICDIETANASPGSLVAIGGRYFGAYDSLVSKVEFDDVEALLASSTNAACTDNWNANQIIVVLPDDFLSGDNPIVRVTANSGYYDTSNDNRGNKIEFLVNSIDRPGLCKVKNTLSGDNSGVFEDELEFQGINLNNNSAYFGSYNSNVVGINSIFGSLSGTSLVPNLNKTGKITVFSQENINNVNSNYLEFIKNAEIDPGPYILSFNPKEGSAGQYVTIMGGGFGNSQGGSNVYFDLDPSNNDSGNSSDYGVSASFDFPEVCSDYLWSDNQILIKVPDDMPTDKENYFIVIDLPELDEPIDTGDDFHTGPVADPQFFYDSDLPLAPSLCKIDPTRGPNNSEVGLWGEYFNEYNPDGNSKVVFYNEKFQSGPLAVDGIILWETGDEVDEIRAVVHSEAITGPVVVIKNDDLAGNSLNFNVGECGDNSDCDNGGVAGVCCPTESTEAGRCAIDKNEDGKIDIMDCYISLSSSVYEWEFTSGDGGGGLGDPCQDNGAASDCPENPECNAEYFCDPLTCTCQQSCDSDLTNDECDVSDEMCFSIGPDWICSIDDGCICVQGGSNDSCQGESRRTNTCDPDPCPNSPGSCSPFPGEEGVDSGVACGDSSCTMIGCDLMTCAYDSLTNKCYNNLIVCSKVVFDIFGNDIDAYCESYGYPVENRWHINTNASCPVDWFSIGNNRCVQTGAEGICEPCPLGLNCMDIDGNNEGECVSAFNICPSGHNCEDGSCVKDDNASCECCCREPGTGNYDARDCCVPLECKGDCGSDRIEADDNDEHGYCTGCRVENPDGTPNYALSDQACNCEGTTGKFCDVNYEINGVAIGACKDCAQLEMDAVECSNHSTVCCVDGMDSNYCRGVNDGSFFESGGVGYCAYYDCLEPNNDSCDNNPQTSGDYDTISDCEEFCVGNLTDNLGEKCEYGRVEEENDCYIDICPSPFGCINEDGSGPSFPDDCGVCCCDPNSTEDECQLAGYPSLNCAENSEPCSGENRGLCCGCSIDSDCAIGVPSGVGCGDDTCCRARPQIDSHIPGDEASEICRNAEIVVNFDQKMDTGSFKGNVILAGDYEFEQCPEGTEYLALNGRQPIKKNSIVKFFLRAKYALKKVFKSFSSPDSAYAYDAVQAGHNFCAVLGQTSGYNDVAGKGILRFKPRQLLDGDRIYYAIIQGDENLSDERNEGVKSIWGIGMNGGISETFNGIFYANAHIFSFEVLSEQAENNGVCEVDHINVEPASYLFQTNVNNQNDDNPAETDTYDSIMDSDKVFVAYTLDDTNQVLAPVEGIYDWSLIWNSNNVLIADVISLADPEIDDQKIIRAGTTKTEGEAIISVAMEYNNNSIAAPLPAPGMADVYLFVCENPWPPFNNDGTWEPWMDKANNCSINDQGCDYSYNFKLYYCRDAGGVGTYDDLPAIYSGQESADDNTVIRGESSVLVCSIDGEYCPPESEINDACGLNDEGKCQRNYLKEVYFFREESPTASTSFEVANGLDGVSAIISWNKILSGVDGYKMYWGTVSNSYIDYAEVYNDGNDDHENLDCEETGDSINCILSGLTGETLYYFNLSSFLNVGTESEYFGEKSVFITDEVAPNSPTNFNSVPGDGQVILSWDEVEGASGYKLYYGVSSGVYGGSEDVGDDTSIILSGLTNGSTYYFVVTAYDEYGNESGYSLERMSMPVVSSCGDGVCEASECSSCGDDCDLVDCCGNGACDTAIGENEGNCDDCSSTPPPPPPPPPVTCGNGICDPGETAVNCPADCGAGAVCGDGVCEASECSACVADCSPADCCNNGVCDAAIGEDEDNCSADCGSIPPPPPPPPPP